MSESREEAGPLLAAEGEHEHGYVTGRPGLPRRGNPERQSEVR